MNVIEINANDQTVKILKLSKSEFTALGQSHPSMEMLSHPSFLFKHPERHRKVTLWTRTDYPDTRAVEGVEETEWVMDIAVWKNDEHLHGVSYVTDLEGEDPEMVAREVAQLIRWKTISDGDYMQLMSDRADGINRAKR